MSGSGDWPTVEPQPYAARGGPRRSAFSVAIEVVTPILGGSSRTREIDEVDVIRATSVRGHLRFWWRALHCHDFDNAGQLYEKERDLWGGVATVQKRSEVEVRVSVVGSPGEKDPSDVSMRAPDAYALWPAREEKGRTPKPPAPRRRPGTRFDLTVLAPIDREAEVRQAVRAWLLFGGYGSRTRRGLGSLTVTADIADWLPKTAARRSFIELFGPRHLRGPRSGTGGHALVGRSGPPGRHRHETAGESVDRRTRLAGPIPAGMERRGRRARP